MYNPYQPIGPDNQPDNTVQTGWTRVETASADNPQSESPAPPPAAYVPWAAAPQPPAPREKPRRDRRKGAFAAVMAACMVFSLGCGFGGGYLASRLNSTASSSGASGGQPVFYQSVSNNTNKGSLSVAEVAAKAADSVVEINTETVSSSFYGGQRVSQSAGSGVILSADGYIVTNNHVVAGADSITVRTRDGKSYAANLVGTDPDTDLAVLKIEASGLTPAVLGSSDDLVVGETAVAIGNPLGELGGTVTSGIISALSREVTIDNQTMTLLQTNAAINPGNSGGGLFNSNGELVGVVNAKYAKEGVEGLGFAIPINTAKPVIEQLISQGYVSGRVDTGFTPIDLTDEATAMQYRVSRTGVYVYEVTTNTDGFQSGDLLLSIDGKDIDSMSDYNAALQGRSVGDQLAVVVLRGNRQLSLTLTLRDANASAAQGSGI
ncbi:S1C family serine protease [Anaeromassilibacillus sp. SJQ-5]